MARQRDWEVAAGVEVVARMSQTTLAPRPDIADRRTAFVQEDWAARTFRVNREAFRSEDVLERERRRIWDRVWLYLGHESEVPRTGDFMQRTLAGRPLIFARDSNNKVRAYLNACPHRGTILCRETEGNAKTYQCFYHAWTFANTGELVGIPDPAAYPPERGFAAEMGLRSVPRFENYRGFAFVSFPATGPSLVEHLGDAREDPDLTVQHSAHRLDVIPRTPLH